MQQSAQFIYLGIGILLGGIVAWVLAISRARRLIEQERLQRTVAETRLTDSEKNLLEQRQLLTEAEIRWKDVFENLSAKALASLQDGARKDLGDRQKSIENLLIPLQESLKSYQQRLQQSETTQTHTLGHVQAHLESLKLQNQTLANETSQLRRVLNSNQARGRWGEETLRRVVEAAGMSPHCDFSEQTQQGDGKPDLIVRLPGDRIVVVDSKVPDLDFITALETADEVKRTVALEAHAAKLKQTIKALADRDYPSQFQNALDYVILFMPAESLFSAALEGDRELIVWAASRKILLATPSSLIALLRAIAMSWQQNVSSENAQKIVETGAELYERMAKFIEHMIKIRDGLEKATTSYNEALGSLERRVLPGAERLKKLGAASHDETPLEIQPIEAAPRIPASLN